MKVCLPLWTSYLIRSWSLPFEECRSLRDYCNGLPNHWLSFKHQEITYLTDDAKLLLYAFLSCMQYVFGYESLAASCWVISAYGCKEIVVGPRYNAVAQGGRPWLVITAQFKLTFVTVKITPWK